jgi:hypothetical protein
MCRGRLKSVKFPLFVRLLSKLKHIVVLLICVSRWGSLCADDFTTELKKFRGFFTGGKGRVNKFLLSNIFVRL